MFDGSVPGPDALAGVDDTTLVESITAWAQTSAAAEARAFAAIAELARRRCAEDDDDDERSFWPADPWDSAGAEVAAALNTSLSHARGRITAAILLRDNLPQTNALFLSGADHRADGHHHQLAHHADHRPHRVGPTRCRPGR